MARRHVSMLSVLMISMVLIGIAASTEIEITKPIDGGIVEENQAIEGVSKDIADFQPMWIVVYIPSINRYYPQDKRSLGFNKMENGEWWTKAILGGSADSGREFQILSILADEKANSEIIDYLDQCNEEESWPGMVNLPEVTSTYDRVSVFRR